MNPALRPAPDHPVVIAIDGPGASGKSTNARRVAQALGFVYVDTGAMYRALAWYCLQTRVHLDDPRAVAGACRRWRTRLHCADGEARLLVDGFDPAGQLRTAEVTAAASKVALVAHVRAWMKRTQRACRRFGNLVMEGRDIGTNVFPETDLKFWLDASPGERHRRRTEEGIADDLEQRDRRDSQRAAAPLMIGLGALRINTSELTAEQTTARILEQVRARLACAGRSNLKSQI